MEDLNQMPLRVINGATVYLKDVAQVRDAFFQPDTASQTRHPLLRDPSAHADLVLARVSVTRMQHALRPFAVVGE